MWVLHPINSHPFRFMLIDEISPIIDIIQKENSYAAIVGDFNINLLQVNEREKYAEFLDLMCTNNFFPRITLPTRIAKRSQSLIDQIFCKVPFKDLSDSSASIVLSAISDHFPCVVNFKILNNKANLRDLIAATGLVILLKLDLNHRFFSPCDLEIWWMTQKNNRAPLLCYFKLCAAFRSHWWIQIGVRVRKRPIWVKFDAF